MGLKIKNMDEVFNNLVEWITAKTDKITDFNIGSAIRTLTEAISIQFEEFYFDMKQNIMYAIENSVYNAFGFELRVSTQASGYATVSFSTALPSSLMFPKGTVFCTSSAYGYIYYESTEDYSAPLGSLEVMIPVQCKTSGTTGNIPSGAINTIVTTNTIIDTVTNTTSFTNGTNEETSAERKKRFQNYIKTLARGTADSIVYGALEVEGVAGAWVDDNYIGYVKLYVHDSDGNLPDTLRTAVLNNIVEYRAGGIEVEVLPIVKHPIDISLNVIIGNDYDTSNYVSLLTSLITSFLNDYSVSDSFYLADLIHSIKSVYDDIVVNILIIKGEDTKIDSNELVRAGDIDVSCTNLRNWRE